MAFPSNFYAKDLGGNINGKIKINNIEYVSFKIKWLKLSLEEKYRYVPYIMEEAFLKPSNFADFARELFLAEIIREQKSTRSRGRRKRLRAKDRVFFLTHANIAEIFIFTSNHKEALSYLKNLQISAIAQNIIDKEEWLSQLRHTKDLQSIFSAIKDFYVELLTLSLKASLPAPVDFIASPRANKILPYCKLIKTFRICEISSFSEKIMSFIPKTSKKKRSSSKKLSNKALEASQFLFEESYKFPPFSFLLAANLSPAFFVLSLPREAANIASRQTKTTHTHYYSWKLEQRVPYYHAAAGNFHTAVLFIKKRIGAFSPLILLEWMLLAKDYKGAQKILKKHNFLVAKKNQLNKKNLNLYQTWFSCGSSYKEEKNILYFFLYSLQGLEQYAIKKLRQYSKQAQKKELLAKKKKRKDKYAFLSNCALARIGQIILSSKPKSASVILENITYSAQANSWLTLEYHSTTLYAWSMLLQNKKFPALVHFIKPAGILDIHSRKVLNPISLQMGSFFAYRENKAYKKSRRLLPKIEKYFNSHLNLRHNSFTYIRDWLPFYLSKNKTYRKQLIAKFLGGRKAKKSSTHFIAFLKKENTAFSKKNSGGEIAYTLDNFSYGPSSLRRKAKSKKERDSSETLERENNSRNWSRLLEKRPYF